MNGREQANRWRGPYLTIWVGQACSLVGSRLATFALVWWLTSTTGSATVLASATLAALLPEILLGPFVGALVDRWNRRQVMLAADGLVALVALGAAWLFWSGRIQPWHIYVVSLARSVGSAFHWPAMQASTSLLVPREHLARVAGLGQMLDGALQVFAPPLGALLLAMWPVEAILGLDVLTAAAAMVSLASVRVPQPVRAADASGSINPASLWSDVRSAVGHIRAIRGLTWLLAAMALAGFFLYPASALTPLLVAGPFGGGARELGWVESAAGIGLLSGGLLLSLWGGFQRRMLTTVLGLVGRGLAVAAIGLLPGRAWWPLLAFQLAAGAMGPLAEGPMTTVFQSAVAPEMQGRVFMLVGSLVMAMAPLGMAVAGPVADALGVGPWFVIGGAAYAAIGLAIALSPAAMGVEQEMAGPRPHE